MKNNLSLVIGLILSLTGIIGLNIFPVIRTSASDMMGGGMMKSEGMKDMMKAMMGGQLPPGINPKELPSAQSQGAQILNRYCTQCHELPGPGMHTANEWPAVVNRMNERMRMMSGSRMMQDIKAPTDSEIRSLLAYLQEHAQIPIDVSKYSELNTPAGREFQKTCSQCHALPDPKQHTANEWGAVVERMKQNMAKMGKSVPDIETIDNVVGFLQRNAKSRE